MARVRGERRGDAGEGNSSGVALGQANVLRAVKPLAHVLHFHTAVVHHDQARHAGPREELGDPRAEAAETHHRDGGGGEGERGGSVDDAEFGHCVDAAVNKREMKMKSGTKTITGLARGREAAASPGRQVHVVAWRENSPRRRAAMGPGWGRLGERGGEGGDLVHLDLERGESR